MHRFFVSPTELRPPRFPLPEGEARHAAQVLRVRSGEKVEVLDGAGRRCECLISAVEKRTVWVAVQQEYRVPAAKVPVEVFPAVAKGKAMELLVQKAVELGAARIVPVMCDRSVAHYDAERGGGKADKWRAIAVEALKQSGREWLPEILPPLSLKECLAERTPGLDLVAALQSESLPAGRQIQSYVAAHGRLPDRMRLWVGPEGDYSPAEYASLAAHGVKPVTLGAHVLRCETALLALLAVCQHELLMRSDD